MLIKTEKFSQRGQSVLLSDANGKTTAIIFNADGIATIDDEAFATHVVKTYPHISQITNSQEKPKDSFDLDKMDLSEVRSRLLLPTTKAFDVKDIATARGYKHEEWSHLKKEALVDYIVSKMQAERAIAEKTKTE